MRADASAAGADLYGPTYAALDLGTNNCRLLVARATHEGFRVVDAFSRIIRLGEEPWRVVSSFAERDPRVRALRNDENRGFIATANRGAAEATHPVLVLLNNDAVPAPGFVAALRDHLAHAGPEVAAVTGRIVLAGRWTVLPAGAEPAPDARVLRDHDGRHWTPSADGEVRLNSTGVRVDRDGNGMDRDWFAPVDRVADVDVRIQDVRRSSA